jgi:2-C-methyl-D-erythritol 2,4-cyclodiphosphate synthase
MTISSSDGTILRVGIGFDVHRLVKDRRLVLGGEKVDFEKGLLGHSDADVLTHAVMSAILGAMAAGSLGDHFPDTDPQYKDIRSIDLLERVRIMMEEGGYLLENLDTMVICDEPKLAKYIENIRMNLSVALRVPIECVSVKATGSEGLGFTGTGEGIAAQAICLLKVPGDEDDRSAKKDKGFKWEEMEPPPELPEIEHGSIKGCVVWTDGATEDNPGPSGIGIVFKDPKGVLIGKLAEHIGKTTNNQAEYKAAIRAARICNEWGVEKILMHTDSKLVANQINGNWKIKKPWIKRLYIELREELDKFKGWKVKHVSRDENTEADRLSKIGVRLKK